MLTHSAFGECDVCRFTWTLVWPCSGIFGGAHPKYLGLGNPAGFSGSMCGASLSSLLYKWIKVTGSLRGCSRRHRYHWRRAGYPIAVSDGQSDSGTFYICCTILISTVVGTIMAIVITMTMQKQKYWPSFSSRSTINNVPLRHPDERGTLSAGYPAYV